MSDDNESDSSPKKRSILSKIGRGFVMMLEAEPILPFYTDYDNTFARSEPYIPTHTSSPVKPRLKDEEIKKLPYIMSNNVKASSECIICKNDIVNDEKLLYTKCHHFNHLHCMTRWLKNTNECPICRRFVISPKKKIQKTSKWVKIAKYLCCMSSPDDELNQNLDNTDHLCSNEGPDQASLSSVSSPPQSPSSSISSADCNNKIIICGPHCVRYPNISSSRAANPGTVASDKLDDIPAVHSRVQNLAPLVVDRASGENEDAVDSEFDENEQLLAPQ